jgi:hypothetical protein
MKTTAAEPDSPILDQDPQQTDQIIKLDWRGRRRPPTNERSGGI